MRRLTAQTLLILLWAASVVPAFAAETMAEVRIKAGFIANFVQFTTWPAPAQRVTVCGLGPAHPGDTLEHLAKIANGGIAITIRRGRSIDGLAGCDVLFLEDEQAQALPGALAAAAASRLHLLVITDFEAGAPLGATISLVATGGGRIGFDANVNAARSAGLILSSRLLQLARRVY